MTSPGQPSSKQKYLMAFTGKTGVAADGTKFFIVGICGGNKVKAQNLDTNKIEVLKQYHLHDVLTFA